MKILLTLLGLWGFLLVLVKLRELRESPPHELPDDEATLMLGLFYSVSQACIKYYKDRGRYPGAVSGTRDGLKELGYLDSLPVEAGSSVIHLFSVISGEEFGYGICLFNVMPGLANSILDRSEQGGMGTFFRGFNDKDRAYSVLSRPLTHKVNLVLPLPFDPSKRPSAIG